MRVIFVCAANFETADTYIQSQNTVANRRVEFRSVVDPGRLLGHSHREVVLVGPWTAETNERRVQFESACDRMFHRVTEADV